ncbi:MAG TPA: ComEC/Rec2 family competence protein [Candidatus Saccharimonadales bacterium]
MQEEARNRRLHPSLLIGWICVGVLGGVVAAQHIQCDWPWLIAALVLLVVAFALAQKWTIILCIIGVVIFGVWRGGLEILRLDGAASFIDKQVTVDAFISDDPEYGSKGEQKLRLQGATINGYQVPGRVWTSSHTITDVKRGDKVTLEGKLREGFGPFSATMSYAVLKSAERTFGNDPGRVVRDWFAAGIRNAIAEPQASLGVGYLVGQKSALPDELNEQLRIAGLTHIVVASGYNLTVLVRFARRLFSKHSKYLSFFTAAVMITAFVLVTGFSSSMSRAALVAGLSLAAWYYGRCVHPVLLLVFSAAVTVCVNPFFIWGDIGWYLSFAAFAGVLLLAPLVTHAIWKGAKPGMAAQLLIETSAAQITTLPIILLNFGTLSLVSLPANLLVLPLVPLAMLLTFIAGCSGLAVPLIAGWFGAPAEAVLEYMTTVIEWVATLPGAQAQVAFGPGELIASYGLILIGMWMLWRKTHHSFRGDSIVE